MKIIVCSTPFQVFNAICIKKNILSYDKVKIYIFDYFDLANEIAENVKALNIFDEVKLCKVKKDYIFFYSKNKVISLLSRLWTSIKYKTYIRNTYGAIEENCEEIYYSFEDFQVGLLGKYYKRGTGQMKFTMFEDGAGSYINKEFGYSGKKSRIYKKFLGYPYDLLKENKNIYLYSPPIYYNNWGKKAEKLFVNSLENKSSINHVFKWDEKFQINNRCVYFDTMIGSDFGGPDDFHKKVIEVIKSQKGEKKILVKEHPRRENQIYKEMNLPIYPAKNIPFEVVCMNVNMEKKLLIATFSSACFTPKLIYDQEPEIILLYKLLEDDLRNSKEEVENFIWIIKKEYRNPEKIHIVESWGEFKEILG